MIGASACRGIDEVLPNALVLCGLREGFPCATKLPPTLLASVIQSPRVSPVHTPHELRPTGIICAGCAVTRPLCTPPGLLVVGTGLKQQHFHRF